MSRIFGVLDPRGVDPEAVEEAARSVLTVGQASLEIRPTLVMGVVGPAGHRPAIARRAAGILVADARVDAVGTARIGSTEAADSAGVLIDVLDADGPAGLDLVAADFALAWWDVRSERLVLARDATGTRPLYWGRVGSRVAFASDTDVLVALGISDGSIDVLAARRYLAVLDHDPRFTGIAGIRRVVGGRWVSAVPDGPVTGGRWFRPENDPSVNEPAGHVIDLFRDALTAAVEDRARGERVGLWLSGGADSGSLAVALSNLGLRAQCMTMVFDPTVCPSEDRQARPLAECLGHEWLAVHQPTRLVRADVDLLPRTWGVPLALPFITSAREGLAAARRARVTTVMEGTGGDALAAAPVVLLDLLRRGHLVRAAVASRAIRRRWIYGYPAQVRSVARGLAPERLVRARDAGRPMPPWAFPGLSRGSDLRGAVGSSRESTERLFLWLGGDVGAEVNDRMYRPHGITWTYPFRDRRVIRMMVGIPPQLLVPSPHPKAVLADAFLGDRASSRVKGDQASWFWRVARDAWNDYPDVFSSHSLVAQRALVRGDGLRAPLPDAWAVHSLRLLTVESWLRNLRGVTT